MNKVFTRANCSPSWFVIAGVILLGIIVSAERHAAEEAAAWTIGALGALSFGTGLVVLGRTVRGWHRTDAAEDSPATLDSTPEALENNAEPEDASPLTLHQEAEALASDTIQIHVDEAGNLVAS